MKKISYLVFATLASLSVVSCGGQKKDPFKPALDVNTSCAITVKGHYDNFEALEEQIVKFNKYYPNVAITYSKVNNYTKEKELTDLFAGNDAPDIFFINNGCK